MSIKYNEIKKDGLSTQIADAIRSAILNGQLGVEERLPSEMELAERFGVSRSTVREALKRLAAQNLIRTHRGSSGGAFVNRLTWSDAHDTLATTSIMVIGMNDIAFEDAIEARFALEATCIPFSTARRTADHIDQMQAEITLQQSKSLTGEQFCASDVRFHRALVNATNNPVLSLQMAGVIEGMQPLMNMLTYRLVDRKRIADLHVSILNALIEQDAETASNALSDLSCYTLELAAARRSQQA